VAEERVKPRSMYVEEAIALALESKWSDALAVNQALLERHGPDEDTHNRIGKALTELGRLDEAMEAYSTTLQLNPLNLIAQKNVRKLSAMVEAKGHVASAAQTIDVELFTEEPGKSGLTVLSPPDEGVAVAVAPGDVVDLAADGAVLRAKTARGVALGEVEPKLARRLLPLIATGNRYTAAVARVADAHIEIIIREVFQAPENAQKSSFPLSRAKAREEFRPYAKESLLAAREIDAEPLLEEEEDGARDAAVDAGEELEEMGMSTFQAEPDETPPELESDDDEEGRPEDDY
jgi:tetratricopeptide (TPR) repeat protein